MNNIMKKKIIKIAFSVLPILLLLSALIFAVSAKDAETPELTEGYTVTEKGEATNIKWHIEEEDGEKVLYFEIDNASSGVKTTVVEGREADGKGIGWGNNKNVPWHGGGKITKIVFGDGITAATGGVYMVISSLRTVVVPDSFIKTGYATFECDASFDTFGKEGTPKGTVDLSGMKELGYYCFDSAKFTNIVFGENAKSIPTECFKSNKFKEIVFPETVESIGENAFKSNGSLKKITFESSDTKISSSAFNSCPQLFTVVGYENSTAYEFAKEKGYEFVDIGSGKTLIEGTVTVELDPEEVFAAWDFEKADDKGLMTTKYEGMTIVNTYWAWFEAEKTLAFKSNASGYNETGNQNSVSDSGTKYSKYKDKCEQVIIGSGIHKVSHRAFKDFAALRTVIIGINIGKIDQGAFENCTSLTSVYRIGKEPEEGVANLTMISNYPAGILKNTGIKTVKLKSGDITLNDIAFIGCENIVADINDTTLAFAKDNKYNLINAADPTDIYEYYEYINPDTQTAGDSSIASFDAETGTLRIIGSGELYDIINYYGGGSKKQPWFSYKNDIKKIVIGPKITKIGKYSFCQCKNLESVELSGNPIEILSGAFEKCYKLKSIYTSGEEPVVGTFDLRSVTSVDAWTFAYNYLLANIVVGNTTGFVSSTLEDCMNLRAVYGAPDSAASALAGEFGVKSADISAGMPEAAICTPPEQNEDEKNSSSGNGTETKEVETREPKYHIIVDNDPKAKDDPYYTEAVGGTKAASVDTNKSKTDSEPKTEPAEGGMPVVAIVVVAAVVVVAVAVVAVIGIKKSKANKK